MKTSYTNPNIITIITISIANTMRINANSNNNSNTFFFLLKQLFLLMSVYFLNKFVYTWSCLENVLINNSKLSNKQQSWGGWLVRV